MTQNALGDALGLTFQQIQKYEKGANRIAASRLQQLSEVLDVPVSYFFEQPAGVTANNKPIFDFLNSAHGLRLLQAFDRIKDRNLQRAVLVLIEEIADDA